ncbi:MAG: NifU family protein [Syntrophomonas sp.]
MMQRINEVIKFYIKPYLQSHGGDIEVVNVDDNNNVTLRLLGVCSNCPASQNTMADLVENVLRDKLPELGSITLAENEDSQELLNLALKILQSQSSPGSSLN